jgi:hypothetical protein
MSEDAETSKCYTKLDGVSDIAKPNFAFNALLDFVL